ncbi:hypothetical protein OG871_34450 [Kitasatospora sp. NBC_00374]|uniref:DUF6629 family protein n=1 Tax=Kitasatospora sp. NBC_00374 TaxID=2975964 RepID=UPI00324E57E0
MCWSAEADAVTGGVVAALGVVCLTQVRRMWQLPLAALPLILGVHQLIEAAVWLGAQGRIDPSAAGAARLAWAVIALPLLPLLVPFGVWCASRRRTALQAALLGLGAAVAVVLAVPVARGPVTAEVHGHALGYSIGVPGAAVLLTGYLLATVGSLLASGDRVLRLLGALVGAGAVVCAAVWRLAFVSTWCALAAVCAVLLLWWVRTADTATRP